MNICGWRGHRNRPYFVIPWLDRGIQELFEYLIFWIPPVRRIGSSRGMTALAEVGVECRTLRLRDKIPACAGMTQGCAGMTLGPGMTLEWRR